MKFIDFEKLAALFLKYWDKFLIDGVSYTLALAATRRRGVYPCQFSVSSCAFSLLPSSTASLYQPS